jgi:hypothetical protein
VDIWQGISEGIDVIGWFAYHVTTVAVTYNPEEGGFPLDSYDLSRKTFVRVIVIQILSELELEAMQSGWSPRRLTRNPPALFISFQALMKKTALIGSVFAKG